MPDDTPEPTLCCQIPIDRAEVLVAEIEEAARLSCELGEALRDERARCQRLYDALVELVGEEEAARIAEGREPGERVWNPDSGLGMMQAATLALPAVDEVVLSLGAAPSSLIVKA